MSEKIKYEPFYNENSDELINDIRNFLKITTEDQITIDTLDICHLLGKIDNLQEENKEILTKWLKLNQLIDNKEDYITNLEEKVDDLENILENAVADCNLRLQENEKLKEDIKILTSDDNDSFWNEEENM